MPQGVHAVGPRFVGEPAGPERPAPHHLVEAIARVGRAPLVGQRTRAVSGSTASNSTAGCGLHASGSMTTSSLALARRPRLADDRERPGWGVLRARHARSPGRRSSDPQSPGRSRQALPHRRPASAGYEWVPCGRCHRRRCSAASRAGRRGASAEPSTSGSGPDGMTSVLAAWDVVAGRVQRSRAT